MRNVRFNDDVIKELRKLLRDSGKGAQFRAALTKIYQAGYDNGLSESTKKIQEVLRDHTTTNHGNDANGEQPKS